MRCTDKLGLIMDGGNRVSDTTSPRLAVVTVAYRSNDVLYNFLDSIKGASHGAVMTVVVDNGPGPESQAKDLAKSFGAEFLELPHNPGYGSAMNAGVSILPSSVRWVLLSNPDVTLTPGVIDYLAMAGDQDQEIAAVGPALLNTDGSVYPSARQVPSLITGVGHAFFSNLWPENPWTGRYRQQFEDSAIARDAGWLSGACVLVRREAFESVGGFDEGFFMYFEDVDLGHRLSKEGYRNRYEPAATVTHVGAHTTARTPASMTRAHHVSAGRFVARKYVGWRLWPVRVALSVGLALRSALLERRAH
jgi:N-acetylglucosaminyl-diphospho-decaprenol L-rhamnosyltransferase